MKAMPRHNEELIQLGIALFKKVCSDAVSTKNPQGQVVWSGTQCEGGGWTSKHKMNEDGMTPAAVCRELELNSILKPARAAYDETVEKLTKRLLKL